VVKEHPLTTQDHWTRDYRAVPCEMLSMGLGKEGI
jgi:hypothetical protein